MDALVDSAPGTPPDLTSLCRREWPRLVGALSLYTGDPQLAEDLAQEAIFRLCRQWTTGARVDAPGPWVHRVAMNLARSHFRRSAIWRRVRYRLPRQEVHEPDQAIAVTIRQALVQLPERQRKALVLRYYADLSVQDVADVMRSPVGTVKRLTSEAITNLREMGLLDEAGAQNEGNSNGL